jgi:hypothetical protein
MLPYSRATVTVATGAGGKAVTVRLADPTLPSLVALMVAEPALSAVTVPLVFTVATASLLEAQLMARPVRVLPLASLVTAEATVVRPTWTLLDANVTVTEATGARGPDETVTVAFAEALPIELVAVNV